LSKAASNLEWSTSSSRSERSQTKTSIANTSKYDNRLSEEIVIRTEFDNGIARLLIDRPARRNAFDAATGQALAEAIEAAQRDEATRVVVIKGAGDVFSTGRDLKATAAVSEAGSDPQDEAWVRIFHLLHRSPIPSVAVVRGYAVAGGFTLAMGCDFVLAERAAVFGAFEMRHGFPAAVLTPILARLMGPRLGLEFAMFGEPISAQRLLEAGLINRLAENPQDLARIEADFVGHLAGLDRRAAKQTRDMFRAAELMSLDNALDMGRQLNQWIGATGGFAKAGQSLGRKLKTTNENDNSYHIGPQE
jgi:enoyl-CoA hydratase/carnithine racemase